MTSSTVGSPLVVVTGAGGYIGTVLVHQLLTRGYRVRALDTFFWGKSVLDEIESTIDVVKADIRAVEPEHFDGALAVVHLAGLSNDPMANFRPDANWDINAVATERVLGAAIAAGVERFTFGSSASLYDGLGSDELHAEDAAIRPIGPYAESKHRAEQIILASAGKICVTLLRQGTVYGHSPRMRFDLVVNTFVRAGLTNGEFTLHGSGNMWRPLVDVTDVALAHIAAIEGPMDRVSGHVFNVLHNNYRIAEVATLVQQGFARTGRRIEVRSVPAPPNVRDYRCDSTKIQEALQFQPSVSIDKAVEHMLKQLSDIPPGDLTHPKYSNIEWMTILDDVAQQLSDSGNIF